jgi:hypothetical protein
MSTRTIFLLGYLVIGLALALCQLVAWRSESKIATFGEMMDAAVRRRTGRLLVLVAWWWIGFHVLARSGP